MSFCSTLATASLSFAATGTGTRAKFDAMLSSVTLSPKAIEFIDSEKQRVLFKGVVAAREQPKIESAFAIVYEDLGPVRVAGDLIAKQLAKVAATANERAAATGDVAALAALVSSRTLFRLADSDESGSLDRAELLRSPTLLSLIRNEDEDDEAVVERFMSIADANKDGTISFVEFANAAAVEPRLQISADADAQAAAEQTRALFDFLDSDASGSLDRAELLRSPQLLDLIRDEDEDEEAAVERFMAAADADQDGTISFVEFANAAAAEPRLQLADVALEAALAQASDESGGERKRGRFGRKSPDERFDLMLESCMQWETELGCDPETCELDEGDGEDEGRMLQVLLGSFAGARCPPVANALRVCYLEYSPLRLGGDLIFKVLKRVVASQTSRRES